MENRREVWALYTAWTDQLRTVAKEVGTSFGESGVLALTATAVNRVLRALHQAGIPAVELSDYDGRSRDRVKVGTVKRAQGLEFTQVLMALVSSALLAVAGSDGSARIGADRRANRADHDRRADRACHDRRASRACCDWRDWRDCRRYLARWGDD